MNYDTHDCEDDLLVLSPLATWRARLGGIQASSPLFSTILEMQPEALDVFRVYTRPRSIRDALEKLKTYGWKYSDAHSVTHELLDLGILEFIDTSTHNVGINDSWWWDPTDVGFKDLRCQQLLQLVLGTNVAFRNDAPVNAHGEPLPWFSYPAIQYLAQLDLSNKYLFEYGVGYSSLFWSIRCKAVSSVESDFAWYEWIQSEAPSNLETIFQPDLALFPESISGGGHFDVIVIDGYPQTRTACATRALDHLNPGGLVVLDDSPFYPDAAAILRDAALIEVDLTGFAPAEDNLQTTSLFLHRDFQFTFLAGHHPPHLPGGPNFNWDDLRVPPKSICGAIRLSSTPSHRRC